MSSDHGEVDIKEQLRSQSTLGTSSGVPVGPESAMRLTAYNACIRLLTGAISTIPLKVYRRLDDNGGRKEVRNHPLWHLFNRKSNPWQTGRALREQGTYNMASRGKSHWVKIGTSRGIVELIPIEPWRITLKQKRSGHLIYDVAASSQSVVAPQGKIFEQDEIFHMRGLSTDGIDGRNVVADMKESIGLAAAQERFGARLYGKGAHFTGVLQTAGTLKGKARERMEDSWNATKNGINNSQGILMLEQGTEWKNTSMSAEDAEFLDARKFQISDISRPFLIPAALIGDTAALPRSNLQELHRHWVVNGLRTWLVNWETQINTDLLDSSEEFFVEFQLEALLRGDIKTRFESYRIASTIGMFNINELRALENRNPVEGGDIYYRSLNVQDITAPPEEDDTRSNSNRGDSEDDGNEEKK